MQRSMKSFITALIMSLLLPTMAHAIGVGSDGGLQVGEIGKDPYWFNVSGVLKFDERIATGDTKGTASGVGPKAGGSGAVTPLGNYVGGANVRDMGVTLEGGVGQDYTYYMAFKFSPSNAQAKIDEAYLSYKGCRHLLPNLSFSIGQVAPGFCLTCAESSKWIPFMERSMATNTFGPDLGLGVSATTYDNHYSATVAFTQQPKAGGTIQNVYGNTIKTHDQWQGSGRFTYAPINEVGKVLHVGFSGHMREYANNGLQFKTGAEMYGNNDTTLLDTNTYNTAGSTTMIAAKNQKTVDFELLGIHGPWSGIMEYQRAYVARGTVGGVSQGQNLAFDGYHAQVSYVLTGESRPYKKSNGTLGQIKPQHSYGAWEVSARYSFISLNSKDIQGGRANNVTGSLSWYANNNIRVIGEYVHSSQSRQFATYRDKRNVGSIGARLQVVF